MDRDIPSFLINYGIEVEFLVAQRLDSTQYSALDTEQDSDQDHSKPLRPALWSCPADSPNALQTILIFCKNFLVQLGDAVKIYSTPDDDSPTLGEFNMLAAGASPRFGSWSLAPSSSARPLPGLPDDYTWIGIKLRTPLYSESELSSRPSHIQWVLGVLRTKMRMAVNSSCGIRVVLQPDVHPLNLLMAKKLASLVWVLEKELLARLCPIHDCKNACRAVSRFATQAPDGVVESRPADPLTAGIMDQNMPRLIDMRTRVQLHHIWSQESLESLDKGLQVRNDNEGRSPSAFGVRSFAGTEDNPVLEFQYGLWHPYETVDTADNWMRLSIALLRATQLSPVHFRGFIGSLDGIIHGWEEDSTEGSLWEVLLSRLGVSDSVISDWKRISNEYADGGMLAKDGLDNKGRLPRLRGLRMKQR